MPAVGSAAGTAPAVLLCMPAGAGPATAAVVATGTAVALVLVEAFIQGAPRPP